MLDTAPANARGFQYKVKIFPWFCENIWRKKHLHSWKSGVHPFPLPAGTSPACLPQLLEHSHKLDFFSQHLLKIGCGICLIFYTNKISKFGIVRQETRKSQHFWQRIENGGCFTFVLVTNSTSAFDKQNKYFHSSPCPENESVKAFWIRFKYN